jgi:hypothetical protein
LYEKTLEVLQQLDEQDVPITQAVIGRKVGIHVRNLVRYPEAYALVAAYTGKDSIPERRLTREAALIQRAEEIISDLWDCDERITLTKVAYALGFTTSAITSGRYPRLKTLIGCGYFAF